MWAIANPDTIEDMVNLSLVIRDPKLKDNLLALNVINDDNNSDNLRIRSKHYLEKAEMIATEANVPLKKVTRYDLNIASGIIHSVKENEITSIITGLPMFRDSYEWSMPPITISNSKAKDI